MRNICLLLLLFFFVEVYSKNVYPLDSDYFSQSDRLMWMNSNSEEFGNIFHWEIIGFSTNDHLPIYACKISKNPLLNEDEINLLIVGQHQSEEPLGTEIGISLFDYLLNNYETNPDIKYIIDNSAIWFVPTVNPEGDQLFREGISRLIRKNKTDSNENGFFEPGIDGVDLNKNYPLNWNEDFFKNPESPYYSGKSPASESEIQAMITFYHKYNFTSAILYHSSLTGNYSERVFYPWNFDGDLSDDYYLLKNIGKTLCTFLPKDYETANYEIHDGYNSEKGFARDYVYDKCKTLPFTIEIAGNKKGIAIVHPENSRLIKIKEKHINMLKIWINIFLDNSVKVNENWKHKDSFYKISNDFIKPVFSKKTILKFSEDFRAYNYNGKRKNFMIFLNNNYEKIHQESIDNSHFFNLTKIDRFIESSKNKFTEFNVVNIDKVKFSDFSLEANPYIISPMTGIGREINFDQFYRNDKILAKITLLYAVNSNSLINIKIRDLRSEKILWSSNKLLRKSENQVDIKLSSSILVKFFRVEITNQSDNNILIGRKVRGNHTQTNYIKTDSWIKESKSDFGIILNYK